MRTMIAEWLVASSEILPPQISISDPLNTIASSSTAVHDSPPIVAEVLAAYREHAQRYYRGADGTPSPELGCILAAYRPSIDGTSANGCCEYTLPGPLRGRLLICFYEGTHTLHTFAFNTRGTAVTDNRPLVGENNESLKFTQPLDIAVHPSGRIYVADFGQWSSFGKGGAIWVLNSIAGK